MTQHLEKVPIGTVMHVRGVSSDVTYTPEKLCVPGFYEELEVDNISMIAGGTGITPCYQIIKSALSNPEDKTVINMIYSNTTEEGILLKDELMKLQKENPQRFKLHFTITQQKDGSGDSSWSRRRIDEKMLGEFLEPPTLYDCRNYVLICGPPGMD
jgi:NAD(P)H-flavin reductase